jgi:hypothetical protein
MKRISALAIGFVAAFALAACQPGDAEKAGENADTKYEEAVDGQKSLTDGPMENAGEAVDKAAADAREGVTDAGNAIEKKADEIKSDMKKDEPK